MRKQIIAGNWKMNNTISEAADLVQGIAKAMLAGEAAVREVVVCPPFTALAKTAELTKGTAIKTGAQNMHFAESGAYTGEVSPLMLNELECSYVIVGHSERREYFGETDELVNQKLKSVFAHHMTPILCVGETLAQREKGETKSFIESQLENGLAGMRAAQAASMVIAYEPIWAIGTGKTATADQAEEVCAAIRQKVQALFDEVTAEQVRIQYGGSVKGENAAEILGQPNIDGALVGGASLTADAFMAIVEA